MKVFTQVTMLYIPVKVNGHPVKAFVDSGAQSTVMSPSCAQECNIMRLIDTRYSGIAVGVGTAKILGRVHTAPIEIAGETLPCAFTVMEGKDVDLLFGLDMLKRYQACIDLQNNKLTFPGGFEVPFLPENEIPKKERPGVHEQTIPGPGGTEIGTETGTIRPSTRPTQKPQAGPSSSSAAAAQQPLGQPPPRPSAPTPTTAAAGGYPQNHIDQLVAISGCSQQQAVEALRACQGNLDYAASYLFSRM